MLARTVESAPAKPPAITLVIPAYNEEARLPVFLRRARTYLDATWDYRIIVVDDGSTDGTREWLLEASRTWPELRLISLGTNRGKGAAVRYGVLASETPLVLVADADGAVPIEDVDRLVEAHARGAHVVCGSRYANCAADRSLARRIAGGAFSAAVRFLTGLHVKDSQCGFKLFEGELARRLFALAHEDRWIFDVEVMMLAERSGARIAEVGVRWSEVPGSKVRVLRDGISMLIGVLRVRRRVNRTSGLPVRLAAGPGESSTPIRLER